LLLLWHWTAGIAWLSFRANVLFFGLLSSVITIALSVAFVPSPQSIAPVVLTNIFQVSGEGLRLRVRV
jgi:hypothetical protein